MGPHAEANNPNGSHALDHTLAPKDIAQTARDQTKDGQDDNVDLGVAEEPEEVLLEDWITPKHAILHAGAVVSIDQEARHSHTKHRQRAHQEEGRDHERPDLGRHDPNAPMSPTPNSGQLVDCAQTRRETQYVNAHKG